MDRGYGQTDSVRMEGQREAGINGLNDRHLEGLIERETDRQRFKGGANFRIK